MDRSLPSDWDYQPLGELCDRLTDGSHFSPTPRETGVPIANVKDLGSGDVDLETCTKISETDFRRLAATGSLIGPGDVLLSKDGTIGKVVVYERNNTIGALSSICIMRPGTRMDRRYLGHALRSDDVARQIANATSGSALRRLVLRTIQTLQLPVPSLPEQRRIAVVLGTADAAARKTEQLIGKLLRMKLGLLHDLLTYGIDDEGELRSISRHRAVGRIDTPVGAIPPGWTVASLRELAMSITSGSRGWARYYAESGPLFLRIGNLSREHINLRFDSKVHVRPRGAEANRTAVQPGDLVISITADLGLIGVIPDSLGPGFVNQHLALVRVEKAKANPRWIAHFLTSHQGQAQFRRLNDQGAKAGLNLPTVGFLQVALPGRAEQEGIVDLLDGHDQRIQEERGYLRKIRALKVGLMKDLLTGRVRMPVVEKELA